MALFANKRTLEDCASSQSWNHNKCQSYSPRRAENIIFAWNFLHSSDPIRLNVEATYGTLQLLSVHQQLFDNFEMLNSAIKSMVDYFSARLSKSIVRSTDSLFGDEIDGEGPDSDLTLLAAAFVGSSAAIDCAKSRILCSPF